jgi:CspA family cold shock protein
VGARTGQRTFRTDDCVYSRRLSDGLGRSPDALGAIFNSTKGFGFISPEDGAKDVFVHATAVEAAAMPRLAEGQRVSFDIQPDARGSKAVNLKAA